MLAVINGQHQELPAGTTVAGALEVIGVEADARGLAVAVDGEVIPRGQWPNTGLREGAKLEVVVAVQGG